MMSIFAENLRTLRVERELTQNEVSAALGVSPQAISKWENDGGMPDIGQLVPIADYFGVTVDFLLGHDPDRAEREIASHIRRCEGELTDGGRWEEQLTANRRMMRKYPKDCRLMLEMCRILYFYPKETGIDGTPESDRLADELVEWGERILRESTDNRIREEAIRWLVYTLDIQGKYEKGRYFAEMMPPYELCRENLTRFLFDDEGEKRAFDERFTVTLLYDIVDYLHYHAEVSRTVYAPEERLRLSEMVRALLEAYFPDGDYSMSAYGKIFESYLTESRIYVDLNRWEDALDSFRRAVDIVEAVQADAGKIAREDCHTSPFAGTVERKFPWSDAAGSFVDAFRRFMKGTKRDEGGIVLYYFNDRYRMFAESEGVREQAERFYALCGINSDSK